MLLTTVQHIARRFYSKCYWLESCSYVHYYSYRGQPPMRHIAHVSDSTVVFKDRSANVSHLQHMIVSGELDQVSLYLHQAVKNRRQLTMEELELILYSCAKVGDCSLAESIFRLVEQKFGEPSPQCCRLLLECYSWSGNLELIWQRLEKLVKDNRHLDAETFQLMHHSILIFQRGDKGKLDQLHQLGTCSYPEQYERFMSFPSHSISTLLIQHSFHEDTKQLRRVFHRYVGRHALDLWTLRIATIAFLRCGYSLALEITQFIHDRFQSDFESKDISSSTKLLTIHDHHFLWNDIVSRICIRASLPPRLKPLAMLSMQIVERLMESSLVLEETTQLRYLSLKRFHSSFLLDWQDDWQRYLLQQSIPGTASKQSYHGMLRALMIPSKPSAYLLGESEYLWKEMENCGWLPDLDSYFLLISHFALNRELNHALQCYKYMCDTGFYPTTYILYQLLEACTKSKRISNRLTFFRDHENIFIRKDIAPWYLRSILQQQQQNLHTHSESSDTLWSRHRYGISALLEQNADIALKLATEWSRWQLPVKTVAFVKLAQILADAGRQECIDVLSQMESHGMELREYFLASLLKRFLYNEISSSTSSMDGGLVVALLFG
ncbi:uncharacterized protein Gasu_49280 [Galdieria sulphuraria]|uniref:Pentatricopeptide (PPR) repeat-containing protein n=1 Tax=Galdieria sulphuraria TaxID=130081 RepID=M2XC45_GALSU|nr:uncharacterized protein Gasu_49280 [Galdieria sulphuraria]EME27477.1 hypothetical protein Gasu_49280 [Galdieria sulphuraria]|eukprot:XP_005703997.1 hypothetical protein Gasu_49280 [Galdieria sulphuraria]